MDGRSLPWATRLVGAVVLSLLLLTALCGYHPACPLRASDPLPLPPVPVVARFAKQPGTLDLGIQPYWLPANLMAEILQRDGDLSRDLAGLGLRIDFHAYAKGQDILQFMEEGLLDGGFIGRMPGLMACAKGQVRLLALASLDQVSLISRQPFPLSELAGKRVGVTFSSIGHMALMDLVRQLEARDVAMIPLELFQLPAALANGQVDAVITWEPMAAHLLQQGGHLIFRGIGDGYFGLAKPLLDQHPQAVEPLLAAYLRAVHELVTNPASLNRALNWAHQSQRRMQGPAMDIPLEKHLKMAREEMARLWIPRLPTPTDHARNSLARAWQFLQFQGNISRQVSWETGRSCFDNTPLDRALEQPAGWSEGVRHWTGEVL